MLFRVRRSLGRDPPHLVEFSAARNWSLSDRSTKGNTIMKTKVITGVAIGLGDGVGVASLCAIRPGAAVGRVLCLWLRQTEDFGRKPLRMAGAFAPPVLGRLQRQRSLCWLRSGSERSRHDRKGSRRTAQWWVLTTPLAQESTTSKPRGGTRGAFRWSAIGAGRFEQAQLLLRSWQYKAPAVVATDLLTAKR